MLLPDAVVPPAWRLLSLPSYLLDRESRLLPCVLAAQPPITFLLENRTVAEGFGRAGQAKIRTEFLLPRLIRDELRLFKDIIG